MRLARAAAVFVSVSLLGSPVAALYCNSADAGAMACCQGDMPNCNTPGKTDDCCRRVPASQDTAAVSLKAEGLEKPGLTIGPVDLMIVPGATVVALQPAAAWVDRSYLVLPSAGPPARRPILRI